MKKWLYVFLSFGVFLLLTAYSLPARQGAADGLGLWAEILVPSLLPFFTAAGLLNRLGGVKALGSLVSPWLGRALRLSPAGSSLLVLGLSGGYPLGAASAAELVRSGKMTQEEAARLLRFCDNTGPAFAVGAVGAGVFGSAGWGALLWIVHALTALLLGLVLRSKKQPVGARLRGVSPPLSPAAALTDSLSAAVAALLQIGGTVCFFSALLGVAGAFGFPENAAGVLARALGGESRWYSALLIGALELSSGAGAMVGLPPTPENLALAEGLLSWGGLCVHLQSAALAAPEGIDASGRLPGKLVHGLFSAGVMYALAASLR